MNRRKLLILLGIITLVFIAILFLWNSKAAAPGGVPGTDAADNPAASPPVSATNKPAEPSFNKTQFSLTDPTSIWIIANKQRRLQPAEYVPDDLVVPAVTFKSGITSDENRLRKVAATALERMIKDADSEGISLPLQSAYRSYNYQSALYGRYVREQGQATADTQSARPGHSEHQTGLAVDLGGTSRPACNVEDCYKDTAEGKWIAANAHTYGFIIRYPAGKQPITGYIYEPWHLRYVGTALAEEMRRTGITTMEEFFDLPAAPDY